MTPFTSISIESLIQRFETQELPAIEWTHEAHLVVAVWYSSQYSEAETLKRVRRQICLHNESTETPNTDTQGYHETLTQFWLKTARQFLADNPSTELADICNAFIQSDQGSRSYPLQYYSKALLFSVRARHQWVAPDLYKWPLG